MESTSLSCIEVGKDRPFPQRLLGFVFILFGLNCFVTIPFIQGNTSAENVRDGVIVGAVLLFVGTVIGFLTKTIVLDRTRMLLTTSFSLFIPLFRRKRSISDATEVSLVKIDEHVRSRYNPFYYQLRLIRGGSILRLRDFRSEQVARKEAERVAKFLNLPLRDFSGATEVVRDPKYLDESLKQRLRRTGERLEVIERPKKILSEIQLIDQTLVIKLPTGSMLSDLPDVSKVAAGLAIPLILGFMNPGPVGIAAGLVLSIVILAYVFTYRETLIVDANRLIWRKKYLLVGNTELEVAINAIEECNLFESSAVPFGSRYFGLGRRGIQLRSDQVKIVFGANLSPHELRYLHYLLMERLTR